MKTPLRQLVARALAVTKAYDLPAVCERYGLAPGEQDEAFASKVRYVLRRLEKLNDEHVFGTAQRVVQDFPDDALQAAIEQTARDARLVSTITRQHLAEALDAFALAGKLDLLEMLRKHWPDIDQKPSYRRFDDTLADDIIQHAVRNDDWTNYEVLKRVGFFDSSQAKVFEFLSDVVHPIRRSHDEQLQVIAALNPILKRDGYAMVPAGKISGYPVYRARETAAAGQQPADALISETLSSFDEHAVHNVWQKALERRAADPDGAITAARTLLETVCKYIIDEAGETYGENDDLPKLYNIAAECLNLAPSQHSEKIFKSILGNCQAVVGNLAGLRNKLGDSHGQGKTHVRPQPRHAELAVNLAGSVATFLVSTWRFRSQQLVAAN